MDDVAKPGPPAAQSRSGGCFCAAGYFLLAVLLLSGLTIPKSDVPLMDHLMFVVSVGVMGPLALMCLLVGWTLRRRPR